MSESLLETLKTTDRADRFRVLASLIGEATDKEVKDALTLDFVGEDEHWISLMQDMIHDNRPEVFAVFLGHPQCRAVFNEDVAAELLNTDTDEFLRHFYQKEYKLGSIFNSGKLYENFGRKISLENLKYIENHEPEIFKDYVSPLFKGATQGGTPEVVAHILKNHFDKIDYEVGLSRAIYYNDPELLHTMMKYYDAAMTKYNLIFNDITDSNEDAMAASVLAGGISTPDGERYNLFSIPGLTGYTIRAKSPQGLSAVLEYITPTADEATGILNKMLSHQMPQDKDYFDVIKTLVSHGADPFTTQGESMMYMTPSVLNALAETGIDINRGADRLYSTAVNLNKVSFLRVLPDIIPPSAVKDPKHILKLALKSYKGPIVELIAQHDEFYNEKEFIHMLETNKDRFFQHAFFVDLANCIRSPYASPEMLNKIVKNPQYPEGWEILQNYMARGFHIKDGDTAGRLLAAQMLLPQPGCVDPLLKNTGINLSVDQGLPLQLAMLSGKPDMVDEIINRAPDALINLDRQALHDKSETLKTGEVSGYKKACSRLKAIVESSRHNMSGELHSLMALYNEDVKKKEFWLTPLEGKGLTPLAMAAGAKDATSIFHACEKKYGIRFTADDFLNVPSTGCFSAQDVMIAHENIDAVMDTKYWRHDPISATRIYQNLPNYLQRSEDDHFKQIQVQAHMKKRHNGKRRIVRRRPPRP